MRRFTALYLALDASTKTNAKVAALVDYFRAVDATDAAWAAYFLTGGKLKRVARSADLRAAAIDLAGVPPWLFEASYDAVGDLAETIALLLPPPTSFVDASLAAWVEERVAPLGGASPEDAQAMLKAAWQALPRDERFVYTKLITGAFRVGAAKQLVYRALAQVAEVAVADVSHRLAGGFSPSRAFWDLLRADTQGARQTHRPYPFFLAHALEEPLHTLGDVAQWQAEWKWDGIRAQLIARGGRASLWSRGEELIDDAFPELLVAAAALPDGTVIDGEILSWSHERDAPLGFASLQRRLNRKAPDAKLQRDVPVVLLAYDLLEHSGADLRAAPLAQRRERLESLLPRPPALRLSPVLEASSWDVLAAARERSREVAAEGLMIKRLDSAYGVGRVRGPWWKWKIAPYSVDAVLVYAQAGHGRRASLFTDYTFAVWHEGELVPFAKAYSGLDDAEIRKVDAWVRAHTLERFGPVRRVEPLLVFEVAFEGVQASTRHKSGIAVRFPRIVRWRTDKGAVEADTLASLQALAKGSD